MNNAVINHRLNNMNNELKAIEVRLETETCQLAIESLGRRAMDLEVMIMGITPVVEVVKNRSNVMRKMNNIANKLKANSAVVSDLYETESENGYLNRDERKELEKAQNNESKLYDEFHAYIADKKVTVNEFQDCGVYDMNEGDYNDDIINFIENGYNW